MIHQYKNNGYNIVLDVNSGSVHVVDDMVYDIIGLYENNTLEQITDALRDRYSVQDIKEAYEEIGELKEAGQLFTEDIYEPYIDNFKDRPTVVKALCLHIAHDCNLACKYCFAEEGEYHGRRALAKEPVFDKKCGRQGRSGDYSRFQVIRHVALFPDIPRICRPFYGKFRV